MSWSLASCVCLLVTVGCHGYRYGAPMSACVSMFPEGHMTDARTDDPPFTMSVNQTTYIPGDVIEVTITSHPHPTVDGEWFMEGILVQARTLNCSRPIPIGTFLLEAGCSDFLQTVDCSGLKNSAVRHFTHIHAYNRTFYWKAPEQAVGHVYLRATVARNQAKFWMNVFSDMISDPTDSNTNKTKCPVQMTYTRSVVGGTAITRVSPLLTVFVPLVAWKALTKMY